MGTYEILIYGVGYVNIESFTATFKIDEALDSAVIVIPRSELSTTYDRWTRVKLTVNIGTSKSYSFMIYSDKVAVTGHGASVRYKHTLGLIEPTKWLEKIPCGSLTFTQPIGGTRYTMYDVVERIRNLAPFVNADSVATTRPFTIEATLQAKLEAVEAPQFYLDKKNLREALIEVFKFINAIPRITYDNDGDMVLEADFINNWQTGYVAGQNIVDYGTEVVGENYATKIESFIENVIPTDDRSVTPIYGASRTDVVSFRADDLVVSDSSYKLLTFQSIGVLLSIKAMTIGETTHNVTLDLTDYCYEKKVWDTFGYENELETSGIRNKPYSFYWEYGTNNIDGLKNVYDWLGVNMALGKILSHALDDQYAETNSASNYDITWSQVTFIIEYIPYIDKMRTEQYREDVSVVKKIDGFESTIQVNPNERLMSLYHATTNVYGQAQRLGVDTLTFAKKHKTLAAYNPSTQTAGIYSLGDYTSDGYIITTSEYVFYNSYIIVRYECSKNFNRVGQFIPISKEFRAYEVSLAGTNRTLKRDIVIRLFFVSIGTSSNANHVNNALITPFMKTLDSRAVGYAHNLTMASLNIGAGVESYSTKGVIVPLIACAEKNTIKFKFDFTSTNVAGNKVVYKYSAPTTYWAQERVLYSYEDGTIDHAKISLWESLWALNDDVFTSAYINMKYLGDVMPELDDAITAAIIEYPSIIPAVVYADYTEFPETGTVGVYYLDLENKKTYIWDSGIPGYLEYSTTIAIKGAPIYTLRDYDIDKDAAEILGIEMIIPIVPNSAQANTFIVGDYLSQYNGLITGLASTVLTPNRWYGSNTRATKADTKNAYGTNISSATGIVTGNYIGVPYAVYHNYDTYMLCNNDGKLMLAVNQRNLAGTKTEITRVYFNFIYER